jgi:hypothetical protein
MIAKSGTELLRDTLALSVGRPQSLTISTMIGTYLDCQSGTGTICRASVKARFEIQAYAQIFDI